MTGIRSVVTAVLASPFFLYRAERTPSGAGRDFQYTTGGADAGRPKPPAAGSHAAYRITDLELASRLSFFLWSTLPDEELLKLATADKLHDAAVLAAQVHRMLADPKSDRRLSTNFAFQWLGLRSPGGDPARPEHLPVCRRPARRTIWQETEAVRRQHLPRGPRRHRPADRELHVPE